MDGVRGVKWERVEGIMRLDQCYLFSSLALGKHAVFERWWCAAMCVGRGVCAA